MTDDVIILSLADRDRWIAEHREGGLPSQSWDYAWGLSASGVDPKLAIVRSGGARMLMPFFERDWEGTVDIATILGLSGASIDPASAAPLSLWREFATAQGWVAGYLQLAVSTDFEKVAANADVVTANTMFLLNLPGRDTVIDSASTTIRRKIRAAERMSAILVDDPIILAARLRHLYSMTMQRVRAQSHYDFSEETLERWVDDPGSLVLGAGINESIDAVCLFRFAATHAEAHIGGTTEEGRLLLPWLIWRGSALLHDRGIRQLNLGGGARPGDGIYRFKEGFRGVAQPLRAVHQIYDPVKYAELCGRAGVTASEGYFPAYRATRPKAAGAA